MNRTYKVAKSLTRGVVVTSEKASSYQGKAVKTVVAAAVAALVAGLQTLRAFLKSRKIRPSWKELLILRFPSMMPKKTLKFQAQP